MTNYENIPDNEQVNMTNRDGHAVKIHFCKHKELSVQTQYSDTARTMPDALYVKKSPELAKGWLLNSRTLKDQLPIKTYTMSYNLQKNVRRLADQLEMGSATMAHAIFQKI